MAKRPTAEGNATAPPEPVGIPAPKPKRAQNRLSPVGLSKLTEPGRYADGGGLWLQVSPTGSKSWLLIYRKGPRGQSKQTWFGLGPLATISLKEARERARAHRQDLLDGKDPLSERRALRAALNVAAANSLTFAECAAAYIKSHRKGWKNAKHAQQWENTLATYASPIFGELPVSAITMGHVLRVFEQPANAREADGPNLWEGKTETATRVRERIERVLTWAEGRHYRSGPNPARWKGNLDAQLAAPSKVAKVKHHPALPVANMPAFMLELRAREGVSARALEFQILTATRTGEVIGATWAEIDLDAAVWVVPGERMKMDKEHRVPLSRRALEILRGMSHRGGFVFPGSGEGKPLSNMACAELMKGMRPGVTVHGTARSTFRDWAAEQTNFAREVVEMSLAHAIGDKVEAAYRRGDLFAKRAKLMAAWESYCSREYLNQGARLALAPLAGKKRAA